MMRERLEAVVGSHSIYKARRVEFDTGQKIPFRTSPTPLRLSGEQKKEIHDIGADVACYFQAVDALYRSDGRVRGLLDTGKPEIFLGDGRPSQYLFVRPDLIITPKGFSICEIETSPFGLALAEILNRGYRQEGFETMVGDGVLPESVQASTPVEGRILYSKKTASYAGQMTFLADEVFSSEGDHRSWRAAQVSEEEQASGTIYRGFYLAEHAKDPTVNTLLQTQMTSGDPLLPSPTPHMEEKANLALIWDKRFEKYFLQELGEASFNHLRAVIPPTWIVGQEEHFALGLPHGIARSVDLASLSRAQRTLVLKSSGFGDRSSWAEGVNLLHQQSVVKATGALQHAQADTSGLHIVQQFTQGVKVPMEYEEAGQRVPMAARVRITPYFSLASGEEGKLVAIKATGCEKTDFIHASSTSVNTAVQ